MQQSATKSLSLFPKDKIILSADNLFYFSDFLTVQQYPQHTQLHAKSLKITLRPVSSTFLLISLNWLQKFQQKNPNFKGN